MYSLDLDVVSTSASIRIPLMLDLPFVFVCILFTDTRKKHLTSDKIMRMHMRLERKMISLRINLDVIREWMTFVRHVNRPLLIDQLANTILPHQVDNINHINLNQCTCTITLLAIVRALRLCSYGRDLRQAVIY